MKQPLFLPKTLARLASRPHSLCSATPLLRNHGRSTVCSGSRNHSLTPNQVLAVACTTQSAEVADMRIGHVEQRSDQTNGGYFAATLPNKHPIIPALSVRTE